MKVNGHKIKELRGSKRVEELATAADFSSRRIEQIEKETSVRCNLNVAKAMAKFLKVKLDDIAA